MASSQGPATGVFVGALAFSWLYIPNWIVGALSASNLLRDALVAGGSTDDFSFADKVGCLAVLALGIAFVAVFWFA